MDRLGLLAQLAPRARREPLGPLVRLVLQGPRALLVRLAPRGLRERLEQTARLAPPATLVLLALPDQLGLQDLRAARALRVRPARLEPLEPLAPPARLAILARLAPRVLLALPAPQVRLD